MFLHRGNRLYTACKPVTAADLDLGRRSPCRGDTTSDRTDADQGRYLTNPKRSLSTPQRPSQTPRVDFHGHSCKLEHSESTSSPPLLHHSSSVNNYHGICGGLESGWHGNTTPTLCICAMHITAHSSEHFNCPTSEGN